MELLKSLFYFEDVSNLSLLWKIFHVFDFALGGTTFIAGTALYFFPLVSFQETISAILYIVGSCGFLGVDVQEFITFWREDTYLAINITLSMIGSTLYIIGSVGFLPQLKLPNGNTHPMGIWGFILGSFFIGSSQIWKVIRILISPREPEGYTKVINDDQETDEDLATANENYSLDKLSSLGVETGACLGGWCFFVGTIMYNWMDISKELTLNVILFIWTAGSVFFTLGSIFLGLRHFYLGLS